MWDELRIVKSALAIMDEPDDFIATLEMFNTQKASGRYSISTLIKQITNENPNNHIRMKFGDKMRDWDNTSDTDWIEKTSRNTSERRQLIYRILNIDYGFKQWCDTCIPHYQIEEPIIIADEHKEWYTPERKKRNYYFKNYLKYLRDKKKWPEESILSLDHSTETIMKHLTNPCRKEAYRARGLVVGYVQSGKTANFTGLLARAADAGYRLFIILAGTHNILRDQTQRRIDKELIGKELLQNDEIYMRNIPNDWEDFITHERLRPSEKGYFDWTRLTWPDYDYHSLKAGIESLEIKKAKPALPLFHPENLHLAEAKLMVIKKNTQILKKVIKDFKRLYTRLAHIPVLIIDDESDHASINTLRPDIRVGGDRQRTATNQKIVELLRQFPRGQYIGYTATPYANCLVRPDDPEDIFPKDFIIALDRPVSGYMGVSDFFNSPLTDEEDDQSGMFSNEQCYIREVLGEDEDEDNLPRALAAYVISGAIKLYRTAKCGLIFPHHTMLIHTSRLTAEHSLLQERVQSLYNKLGFSSPKGMKLLEQIWKKDFKPTSDYIMNNCPQAEKYTVPDSFNELRVYIGRCLDMLEDRGVGSHVLMINSLKDVEFDFNAERVWKIIVGGNKLSRGYTVEGLTVSYYRRASRTGDTLMQMGRWFGFRRGYRDLVRLFVGTMEGTPRNPINLLESYKEVCQLEESFREELKRYIADEKEIRITPKMIPPLIEIFGDIPPTSSNKMYNAKITNRNYGGKWKEKTKVPVKDKLVRHNQDVMKKLLSSCQDGIQEKDIGGGLYSNGQNVNIKKILYGKTGVAEIVSFLKGYKWYKDNVLRDVMLQIEFLEKENHDIKGWQILAFQIRDSFGKPWNENYAVLQRQKTESGRIKVFTESEHRAIAEYIVDIKNKQKLRIEKPCKETRKLKDSKSGVFLFYPVRQERTGKVTMGFALLYPDNNLKFQLKISVIDQEKSDAVVIDKRN